MSNMRIVLYMYFYCMNPLVKLCIGFQDLKPMCTVLVLKLIIPK